MSEPLRCHLHTTSSRGRVLRMLTPRPQDGLRISTNRYHDTWHIVCAPGHVRALRRLFWAMAFERHEHSMVVLAGDVLQDTPFDAAPSLPVIVANSDRVHLRPDDVRALLRRLGARRASEGTVKLQTFGLDATPEEAFDRAWFARQREAGEARGWSDLRVERIDGAIVFYGPPEWLKFTAAGMASLERALPAGSSNYHYIGDWWVSGGSPGEVQVFGDYDRMLAEARLVRDEDRAAPPGETPEERSHRLGVARDDRSWRRIERAKKRQQEREAARAAADRLFPCPGGRALARCVSSGSVKVDPIEELLGRLPGWWMAGAAVAQHDEARSRLAGALSPVGARVPAIARLVEALEQVGAGREGAMSLLTVSVAAQQIGGARARLAEAPGELAPLEAVGTVRCKAAPAVVELMRASVEQGAVGGPDEVILDLRLMAAWVSSLDRSERAMDTIVTRIGPMAVPYLLDRLDLRGEVGHGRRLEVLARLAPEVARPWIARGLEEGSAWVRAGSLRALARLDEPAAVAHALGVMGDVRARRPAASQVIEAACEVLAQNESDEAIGGLEAMLTMHDETLRRIALAGLSRSSSPRARELLLRELPLEVAELRVDSWGNFKGPAQAKVEAYEAVLGALRGRLSDEVTARLGEVLKRSRSHRVREVTLQVLLEVGSVEALRRVWVTVTPMAVDRRIEEATQRAIDRQEPGIAALLTEIVDLLDKADRSMVYLGLIRLEAREQIPWLHRREFVPTLTLRERALLRQALDALEGRGRG